MSFFFTQCFSYQRLGSHHPVRGRIDLATGPTPRREQYTGGDPAVNLIEASAYNSVYFLDNMTIIIFIRTKSLALVWSRKMYRKQRYFAPNRKNVFDGIYIVYKYVSERERTFLFFLLRIHTL